MGTKHYGTLAVAHAIVAAIHAGSILQMAVLSIKKRRLAFSGGPVLRRLPAANARGTAWVFDLLKRCVFGIYVALFTRTGLFGVYGPCFELVLLARELVETLLRTIQAYRMSHFLPRAGLNRFYVGLLVLNCWSTVFVHQIFHDSHLKRYFAALMCDFVLDWVSAIVVPSVLALTYSKDIDNSTGDFFGIKWFEDVWFMNALNEFQMILVVSWADLATRMVFALGMISNMQAVKRLVTVVLPNSRQGAAAGNRTLRAIAPAPLENDSISPAVSPSSKPRSPSWLVRANLLVKTNSVLSKALRFIFFSWGATVLVLHIRAEMNPLLSQCKMQVRPRGVSEPSCSLVILDCHRDNLTGASDGVDTLLKPLHHPSLVTLLVRHCPRFEMPKIVTKLRGLQCLKMYNTTITRWASEAAFTEEYHPEMMSTLFARVSTVDGKIPAGLLADDFPRNLRMMAFVVSNIREVPDDLHLKWPHYGTLNFDTVQFTEVPAVLAKLTPSILVLAGTPISQVPSELFEVEGMGILHLEDTLITALPERVASPSTSLSSIVIQGTNVSYFPAWVDQWPARREFSPFMLPIPAANTPYCLEREQIMAGSLASFSAVASPSSVSTLMDASPTN